MKNIPEHYSSLIYQYLKKYQDDPQSKIFAPLAEAYRKAGLIDEAIEVAEEGLLVHPKYIGGRVALARALFDKKEYEKVIFHLEDVLESAPDNIIALKLNAESYLMLGRMNEALYHYKLLLYYTPHDSELVAMVKELETESLESGATQLIETKGLPQKIIIEDENIDYLEWKNKVLLLQDLLVKVERYKQRNALEF